MAMGVKHKPIFEEITFLLGLLHVEGSSQICLKKLFCIYFLTQITCSLCFHFFAFPGEGEGRCKPAGGLAGEFRLQQLHQSTNADALCASTERGDWEPEPPALSVTGPTHVWQVKIGTHSVARVSQGEEKKQHLHWFATRMAHFQWKDIYPVLIGTNRNSDKPSCGALGTNHYVKLSCKMKDTKVQSMVCLVVSDI